MLRHVFDDEHQRYTRISKREARKLFDAAGNFYIIAHKMRPGFPFSMGMTVIGARYAEENAERVKYGHGGTEQAPYTFDILVRDFCWYNANCHETGTYAAFYTETERKPAGVAHA